jgi:hypothetical protein
MNVDLDTQIRNLYQHVDGNQEPVTLREVEDSGHPSPAAWVPLGRTRRQRGWAVALSVLLLVGLVTVLAQRAGGDEPVVDQPAAPTVADPVDEIEPTDVPDQAVADPVDEIEQADVPDPTSAGSVVSVEWSPIDDLTPIDLISDGTSFYALSGRGPETELLASADGTTWQSVASVPFDHLDAAWNGKVLSVKVEQQRSEGRFEASITVYVVEADGTVSESVFSPTIPERHELFVEGLNVSAAFLDPEGVVITGSYHLSHRAVVAAGIGISLEEISGPDTGDEVERLLAEAGVDMYSPGSLGNDSVSIGDTAVDLSDLGLTGQELMGPLGLAAISSAGADWVQVELADGVYFDDVVTIEGALVAQATTITADMRGEVSTMLSTGGVDWETVPGLPTGYAILIPWNGRAIWASVRSTDEFWVIDGDAGSRLDSETNILDREDPTNTDGFTLSAGAAGIAYITGWDPNGSEHDPINPTEIAISPDGEDWTILPLPPDVVGGSFRLAVGADGFVMFNYEKAVWYGAINVSGE